MLERIVQLFYIPWVFWGTPLLIAIGLEAWRRLRINRTRDGRGEN